MFILALVLTITWFMLGFRFGEAQASYNLWNYYLPQMSYLIRGVHFGDAAIEAWYRGMAKDSDRPHEANGPGPTTTTFCTWHDVKKNFESWGKRIQEGTMRRENELGMTVLNSGPFAETGRIALGYSTEDHRVARPFIGNAIDGARCKEREECDGSKGWNATWLRRWFRERFAGIEQFDTADLVWWVAIILVKLHINVDLNDEEAKAFNSGAMAGPKMSIGLAQMPPRLLACPFMHTLSGTNALNRRRQKHVDMIKENLPKKFPKHEWDERSLMLVANMFMDSLWFAGGLSVPTVLQNMLSLWFAKPEYRPVDLDTCDPRQEGHLRDFMWETLRKYAAVAGVPRWVTDDGGATWQHEIPNIEQAVKDPKVFENPFEFKLRRPGLNHQNHEKSLFWADFALVDNDVCHPDSHACPGKQLAQEMIIACMQEFFLAGPWGTDSPQKVGYLPTGTFVLKKLRPERAGAEGAP